LFDFFSLKTLKKMLRNAQLQYLNSSTFEVKEFWNDQITDIKQEILKIQINIFYRKFLDYFHFFEK